MQSMLQATVRDDGGVRVENGRDVVTSTIYLVYFGRHYVTNCKFFGGSTASSVLSYGRVHLNWLNLKAIDDLAKRSHPTNYARKMVQGTTNSQSARALSRDYDGSISLPQAKRYVTAL